MPFDLLMDWAEHGKKDFVWQPEFATSDDESPALFAHALYDHYSAPGGFNYFNGGLSMKNTQNHADLSNVGNYVNKVRDYAFGQANQFFNHNQVLLMFGDDFSHPQADRSYQLMDAIIDMMQSEIEVIVKYSTVHDYIEGIKEDARRNSVVWPIYKKDLFPYFTDMTEYWSGYYTTAPFFKKTVR